MNKKPNNFSTIIAHIPSRVRKGKGRVCGIINVEVILYIGGCISYFPVEKIGGRMR
jgi:hypothetical protein